MNQIFLTFIICFLLFGKLQGQTKTFNTFESISAIEFKKICDAEANAVIIDVRSKKEYRKGHIQNSILAENKEALNTIAETLDYDQPLLVYCDEGTRSITACTILKEKGFLRVYNLESGLKEWEDAGFELVK